MSIVKWTSGLRRRLYARILQEFGPHSEWNGAYEPLEHKERFARVLEELAEEFAASTGKPFRASAVRQQMNFAVTPQMDKDFPDPSHRRTLHLNKIAAKEVGFIT